MMLENCPTSGVRNPGRSWYIEAYRKMSLQVPVAQAYNKR